MISAGTLIKTAREAGYREVMVAVRNGKDKVVGSSLVQNFCPRCDKKRLIRFRKVRKTGPGKPLVDRCWDTNCGFKREVI